MSTVMSEESAVEAPRISLSRLEEDGGAALDAALQRHSFVILQDLPEEDIETVRSSLVFECSRVIQSDAASDRR
jgi:hypothetical protein